VCEFTERPHTPCSGKDAIEAAKYPFEIWGAILVGPRNHLKKEGRLLNGVYGILPSIPKGSDMCEEEENCLQLPFVILEAKGLGDVFDAATGQVLRGELVREARKTEMVYFEEKEVWDKRPWKEALDVSGNEATPIVVINIITLVHIHPANSNRILARLLKRLLPRPLVPDFLFLKVHHLCLSSLSHQLSSKYLSCSGVKDITESLRLKYHKG
jgi:hypothetical protein